VVRKIMDFGEQRGVGAGMSKAAGDSVEVRVGEPTAGIENLLTYELCWKLFKNIRLSGHLGGSVS